MKNEYSEGIARILAMTPEELQKADWKTVLHGMKKAREELEKTGIRHSWFDPYYNIVQRRAAEE